MLTAKNVSAKKAVEYFLQGYYQEGKSRWFGIGAEKLGLAVAIDNEEIFNNIVQGRSPDGKQQLCTRKTQAEQRRAALDCTFEAPKSVSLTALPGGDERLVEAHAIAVESALALIESRCAHTRVSIDKQRLTVNTGNLVVAQFDHIESRELDPHLHTHCLLMNMVQTVDGKWYSHLNDAIFQHKKYWGMVYQHFLAAQVQKLGYEIEWKGHGQFELKGYTAEELKEFSKRRQQILAVVGANSTWAEREAAWKATRSRKQEVKPVVLLAKWREETELFGIQFVQPKQTQDAYEQQAIAQLLDNGEQQQQTIAQQLDVQQQTQQSAIAQQLLDDAIRHCEQRQVIFALADLEKFVLSAGILVDPKQLEPLFQQHQELIRLELKEGVRYTTHTAVWRDRATVHLMRFGQEAVSAIAQPEMVKAHLLLTKLNAEQRSAVELAATTTDRFIVWQGVAGAGKTWALQELKAIAEAQGYTVKGFGITTDAENELKTKAGVEATTVASLLVSKQPEQPQPNQLWVVDEAGMLSAKQCYGLMQRAASEGARVVLVGDVRQFSAVEAGNPFKLLQLEGIKTAHMEESLRQRHNPELKIAIDLIAQGKIEQGFARLDESKRIISCDDQGELTRGITAEYLKIAPEKRVDSLVLAGTHKQRLEITLAIRDALKAEGSLATEEVLLKSLVAMENKNDLSKVKFEYTHNFEIGDVVVPVNSYLRRQLEKGVAYEVVGKSPDFLQLGSSVDRTVVTVDPRFDKSVYRQTELAIAVGDRLRWTKIDRKLERYNGNEVVVEAISGDTATLRCLDNNRIETIDLTQPQHLDYSIVRTTYSAQGKDAHTVLAAADFTVTQESFYVAVSRCKQELKLFTQDSESLLELAKHSKSNESALDKVRQHMELQIKAEVAAALKRAGSSSVTENHQLSIGQADTANRSVERDSLPTENTYIADVLVDVEKLVADYLVLAQSFEENNNGVRSTGIQFDGASLGRSIAQQLSIQGSVEVQPKNIDLLQKAARTQQQLALPRKQPHLNPNLTSFIPPSQERANQLDTAHEGDRSLSLQLDRIRFQQQQTDLSADAVMSQLEEISQKLSSLQLESIVEQLSIESKHLEPTHENTTARNPQQPKRYFSTDLGRSIANRLEASDERNQTDPSRDRLLQRSARKSGRPDRSPGAIKPHNHPILQHGLNQNRQSSFLPIPASQSTQRNRLNSFTNESDRDVARKLKQIDRHHTAANSPTDATVERLGNFLADLTATNETAAAVGASSRPSGEDVREAVGEQSATPAEELAIPADLPATTLQQSATLADLPVTPAQQLPTPATQLSIPADLPSTPADLPATPALTTQEQQKQLLAEPALEENRSYLEIKAAKHKVINKQRTVNLDNSCHTTDPPTHSSLFISDDPLMTEQVTTQQKQLSPTADSIEVLAENQASNNPAVEQNYQRTIANHRVAEPTATNIPTANENYRDFEDQTNSLKAIADQVRSLPLEDVALMLGLQLDRYDKHKWRKDGLVISINDRKFYDHASQKGGYGAIDLVMHVQRQNFKQALDWLSNGASSLPPQGAIADDFKVASERKPFIPPIADESKWTAVRQYLTADRQLPAGLIDELHRQGRIYADSRQNAVFLRTGLCSNKLDSLQNNTRHDLYTQRVDKKDCPTYSYKDATSVEGDITGASLRGTYSGSSFKGLAKNSRREGGWFSFTTGLGKLEQIVLTEAAIDALSAAALFKQQGKSMFIASDGNGAAPIEMLRIAAMDGTTIKVAHDADRAGELMAWRVASQLPSVTRVIPTIGDDWNQQLVGSSTAKSDIEDWKAVATALGKPETYINRIAVVTSVAKKNTLLPENAAKSLQQDVSDHKKVSNDLWQWLEAANALGKSEQYLHKIIDVAKSFHHPIAPTPLSEKAVAAMQQDIIQHERLMAPKLWLHYSQGADPKHPMKTAITVAKSAMKDGYTGARLQRILEHDPQLVKIRQRAGDLAAQNHLKIAIQNAQLWLTQRNQPPQHKRQHHSRLQR